MDRNSLESLSNTVIRVSAALDAKLNGLRLRLVRAKLRASGITLGENVYIGRNVTIVCLGANARLVLEDDVAIQEGTALFAVDGGQLVIGRRTQVNRYCEIFCRQRVTLGEDCGVGAYSAITDSNHIFSDRTRSIYESGNASAPVTIGAQSWLGYGVRVLPGVTVGRHALLAAGAVVTRDVPEYTIAAGVPARALRAVDDPGTASRQEGSHMKASLATEPPR